MNNSKEVLAIIPTREGSKGVLFRVFVKSVYIKNKLIFLRQLELYKA